MNSYTIRQLPKQEPIPYHLLLLADEEMQAIEYYIHLSDIHVVEAGATIIGVYALYLLDEHQAEIKAIAVEEAYQNQGVGKLMLKHAEVKAHEKGFSELIIGTPTVAQKQLSIYQKAGFKLFSLKKDFFITHYSKPIYEDGIRLRDMAMLKTVLKEDRFENPGIA